MVRRALILAALAAIVITRIEPQLLRFPFNNLAQLAPRFEHYADQTWWEYAQFIRGVREQTRPGDTVAVLVPVLGWEQGYSYAYYRASYFLAGREVLPLVDPLSRRHPENLQRAQYVAVWRTASPPPFRTVVWSGHGGMLVRR
jgi:hypothetical protein